MAKLGVNVDHVATIRQARGTIYPDPLLSALAAIRGGADQITIHLREDRRHIQDHDLIKIKDQIRVPLNLEMAAVDEIITIACKVKPAIATLVPERRFELTTEGGLDVIKNFGTLKDVVRRLKDEGISVSMFIDPERPQVEASINTGANAVELHTGAYCDAVTDERRAGEMERLVIAARFAAGSKIKLCAGHGINYDNASFIAQKLPEVLEYNIGHSIVARSIFTGMEEAVREMKGLI